MKKVARLSLEECYADMPDPRVKGRCTHNLVDIIIITVCAVVCGAQSWVGVETVGKAKEAWFRQYLNLEYGIPSHDTFGYVFARLKHEEFQLRFIRWVSSVFEVSEGQVVALDGKTLRGSHDRALGKDAIHMISAWASESGLVLGQRKVDDKSNEITAIPELLRLLELAGCIVTIDAMGCQTEISQTIRDEGADYILQVKGNQGNLKQDIADCFNFGEKQNFEKWSLPHKRGDEPLCGKISSFR